MSSILDALRKSAQIREQRGRDWTPVPGSRRFFSAPRQSRLTKGSVLIGVVLGIGMLWWFVAPDGRQHEVPAPPTPVRQPAVAPVVVVAESRPGVRETARQTKRATTPMVPAPEATTPGATSETPDRRQAPLQHAPKPVRLPAPRPLESDIVSIFELPEALRNKVEGLTLNVHVYADDPAKRLSLINMRSVRSGDRVAPGVRVQAIVPRGVVLLVQGRRVLLETRHR